MSGGLFHVLVFVQTKNELLQLRFVEHFMRVYSRIEEGFPILYLILTTAL